MKMGIGLFWGIVLIIIGLSIILKVFFDISIFRIIIGLLFMLIGFKILVGKSALNIKTDETDVVFNDRQYNEFPLKDTEYNTVFGKSIFDFSKAVIPLNKNIDLEFNTVFGDTKIILPHGLPVRIKAEARFGSAKLPKDNSAVFGSSNYVSDFDPSTTDFIDIEINAIFGHTEVNQ